MAECDGFMLMGIHKGIRNYKHGFTRRYLFLDAAGRPYRFDGRGGYKRTTKAWAIKHVFDGLEDMGYERTTPWNEVTRADRLERMRRAGWTVIEGGRGAASD